MRNDEKFSQTTPLGSVEGAVTRYLIDAPAAFHVPYEGDNPLVRVAFPDGFLPSPATHHSRLPAKPAQRRQGAGNAKLGDGKFVVIEQGEGVDGEIFNKLMLVEIGAATEIGGAAFRFGRPLSTY